MYFFLFEQKTAYEMRISDWSSDVCSSDLTYENFSEKTGDDFDKEYIDQMVKDHRDVIDDFEEEAREGNDPEIKSWASGKLTTLRHHQIGRASCRESVCQYV